MLAVALVHRIDAAVALVAHGQPTPTHSAQKQALQQAQTFSGWSDQTFAIGSIGREPVSVGGELLPVDVAFMVIADDHTPGFLWHGAQPRGDLAGRFDLLARLIAAEYVGAG